MSTDLVPAANMAALDTLDPETRELMITSALEQANSWLAHVDLATEPVENIANFRAYVATVAEASRRLKVSKECQMHAEVVVRRSERTLGLSIREGQSRGDIRRHGEGSHESQLPVDSRKLSPSEFAKESELMGNGAGIYQLADDVTDEHFEEAIVRAQEERNVSRANVVRKVREAKSGTERQTEKWDLVADMALKGYSSPQVAHEIGAGEQWLRTGAKARGITFPADKHVLNRRRLDMRRVIGETVSQLGSIAETTNNLISVDAIRASEIGGDEIQEWVDSLTVSIKALSKALKTIKESIS